VKRIVSAVSSIFACGIARLTPEQKAKLDEMERDYDEFMRQRPGSAKVDCSKKFATESNRDCQQHCDQTFTTMKNLTRLLTLTVSAFALVLSCESVFAQQPPDWANMDPQQIQQQMQKRMMDNFRERLVVTNDAEWGVIEERLSKVVRVKMETMFSGGMGMMGGMRRGGNGPGGGFRGFPGFGQPDPDAENLQKTIEGNAPSAQIKSALAKLREARKQKQAELAKLQGELRQVLTMRQEASLVLAGILD
jgi:hypothetical protein